jgi:phosphonate transport system permease protein
MPTREAGGKKQWRRRDRRAALLEAAGWLLLAGALAASLRAVALNTEWELVWNAPQVAADLAHRMLPPRWSYMERLWRPLWDTLNIATLGTLLSLGLATPLALLAARNTTPHPAVRALSLGILAVSRSVNTLIWAMLFVAVLGPGVLAGIAAIGVRSVGFVAKLLYEAIEEADPRPVEAIRSTGASGAQVLSWAIAPQVLPDWAGIAVFRWDINVRESTVVGLVGAGGLGLELQASVEALYWPQVSMIFVLVFALVLASETVSARVRRAFL